MNDFLVVTAAAGLAAGLTYLGAPAAERFDVSHRVVSASLQFAAGVVTALVMFSLMPAAVDFGPLTAVLFAFFAGGALFVLYEAYAERRQTEADPTGERPPGSMAFYTGVLIDLFVDGVVIGLGSAMTLRTGFLLALGMAISTLPLAFVTIAAARQHGMSAERRQRLSNWFVICILGGALLGYGLLRNQPANVQLTLVAAAAGFLITLVTQGMIPEANREGEPRSAGIYFVAGISIYAFLTLMFK